MGADLLLTALVWDESTKLNWPAGRRVIQKMHPDDLWTAMDSLGRGPETLTAARKEANDVLSALKAELRADARDAYRWVIRGAIVEIRGGTSWGDDPSEGWTAFTDAYCFPEALRAIGFEIEPRTRKER